MLELEVPARVVILEGLSSIERAVPPTTLST